MLVLKRVNENYSALFESKQDEERLRAYDDLFNQYMEIKKKLPNLYNQFKDFSKIKLNTSNKENDIQNKKEFVSSYSRLVDLLHKDSKSLYRKRNITNFDRLSGKTLETILDNYMKIRDMYFKDQERFSDFVKLRNQDIKDIQKCVDPYVSKSAQNKQDKVECADKLYED